MEQERRTIGGLEKFDIKLKSKPKDGIILQLHHTIRGSNGECRRIRFSTGAFDDIQEKLACVDNGGNLFVLDFCDLKFWKLPSIGPCSALHFVPSRQDKLIVASVKKYDISFLCIDNGVITRTLTGHTAAVKHISFSNTKTNYLLTGSAAEAILWELTNYTKYFTLNTYLGAQIQQILFTPNGEHLVACFQNDTVQIWKHESMKSVKQIIPNELKHMRSIAFTLNGRAMAMAGLSPILILFSMDTWKALKSINLGKFNISGVHEISFVPQVFDGGANKILGVLSSDCILHLLDLESMTIVYTISPESSNIRKFVVSPTGKYFFCILQLGEVNIYNSSYILEMIQNKPSRETVEEKDEVASSSKPRSISPETSQTKAKVEQKMRICMDSARLRRILMQYGEYPDKFRSIIWASLLNIPRNRTAYAALIDMGIHPTYKDIEKQFTIHSTASLKSLKRLLSCLAHWCPLFGVMKFIPGFVFPFVKVLQKDPLLLFECVSTVLLNYCQLWFEYAPFPPISVLAMTENILAEHDHQLLDHFCSLGITSQTYALKMLETAFSEVLTCSEWLILWDHILSNEPAFLLMAVVSYCIVQRNAIMKIKNHDMLEKYFNLQNPLDKKALLKKTYILLRDTSEDIHPRKFFNAFVSLDKGSCYQQFTGYPKATICLKLNKNEKVKKDRSTLKDLTATTQKKHIKDKANSEEFTTSDFTTFASDDDSFEESIDLSDKNKKSPSKKYPNEASHSSKVKETSQLIQSILYPEESDKRNNYCASNNNYEKDKVPKKVSRKQKSRKTKIDGNLEKEIKNLISMYTNSEKSDM